MTCEHEWRPISTLPPPGDRNAWVMVVVEGKRTKGQRSWRRRMSGFAATHDEGFEDVDIQHIELRGDMDEGSGRVTHWMPLGAIAQFPEPNP